MVDDAKIWWDGRNRIYDTIAKLTVSDYIRIEDLQRHSEERKAGEGRDAPRDPPSLRP